jgi:mannose/fructose/N-acetylgalactosamine-specific phosphotransferase system component IIC
MATCWKIHGGVTLIGIGVIIITLAITHYRIRRTHDDGARQPANPPHPPSDALSFCQP